MTEFKSLMLELKALDDESDGEFEAILSTPDVDRDDEIVKAHAFAPLPASIPVYRNHGWLHGDDPIGDGVPFYDGDILKLRGRWAPSEEAQKVRTLVNGGFIKAMSAGFMVKARDRNNRKIVTRGELLEGSTAGIPVNRNALMLMAKSLGVDLKAGARNSGGDAGRLQTIHDLAVENGAACATTKSVDTLDAPPDEDTDSQSDAEAADTPAVEAEVPAAPAEDEVADVDLRGRLMAIDAAIAAS